MNMIAVSTDPAQKYGQHLSKLVLKGAGATPVASTAHTISVVEMGDALFLSFKVADVDQPTLLKVGEMRGYPLIMRAIADFVIAEKRMRQVESIRNILKSLRHFANSVIGVVNLNSYIDREDLGSLPSDLLLYYIQVLNGKDGTKVLAKLVRSQRYNMAVEFLYWCLNNKTHAKYVVRPDIMVPGNPWPRSYRDVKPRQALDREYLFALRAKCLEQVDDVKNKITLGRAYIEDHSIVIPPENASYRAYEEMAVVVKTMKSMYPGPIGSLDEIGARRPGLRKALRQGTVSLEKIREYLYVDPRRMVPFIVLFAMDTYFNPQTILELNWADVDREHFIFGTERWRISGEKRRARRRVHRSFAEAFKDSWNPVGILEFLSKAVRDEHRATASERARDRVFLTCFRGGDFTSFVNDGPTSSVTSFDDRLQRFIKDTGLKPFSLTRLRATGADIANELTGGDLKAQQQALQQASADTAFRHYHNAAGRARGKEALAEAQARIERYVSTDGLIDTRDGVWGTDPLAATPGFRCFEPRNSPIAGQVEGELCSAYGACPTCPNADVDHRDPTAFIRLAQLHDRLLESQFRVPAQRWLDDLQYQLEALERVWLPSFSNSAMLRSNFISLPPIPEID